LAPELLLPPQKSNQTRRMDAPKKGKTLWEMLMHRLHGSGSGNGSGISFYNPLDLRVGSALNVPYSNGAEFANYDFQVKEIREYTRRIGEQDFQFTDYWLSGTNTRTFTAEDTMQARVRGVPNAAGAFDSLLLRLEDEFAFAEDFLEVVKDPSGIFEVTDDKTGAKQTFDRINDLKTSYEAAVMAITETTPDGKAASAKTKAVKLEYWDYWREADLGGGKIAKEFIFVELNSETGWFQIWRGREFFP
jgi:hypothetical protein